MPGRGKLRLRAVHNYTPFCARWGHGGEQEQLGPCPRGGPILAEDRRAKLINTAQRQRGWPTGGGGGAATLTKAVREESAM